MVKKGIGITLSILCLVAISLAIWFGGRERWEIAGLSSDMSDKESSIAHLEGQLKEEPESTIIKYNLAYFYYRSGRFEEARDLLQKLVESKEKSNTLSKKVFYNMGNSLYRLAENEEDLEHAINLLGESLRHYRTVIEIEKQEKAYTGVDSQIDEDTTVNYTLVQRRLKIITDKLDKRKKDAAKQKGIYQLVKELLGEEQEIHKRLAELQQKQGDESALQERKELLTRRSENRKRLQIIQEKIQQELGTKSSPPGIKSRGQTKSI